MVAIEILCTARVNCIERVGKRCLDRVQAAGWIGGPTDLQCGKSVRDTFRYYLIHQHAAKTYKYISEALRVSLAHVFNFDERKRGGALEERQSSFKLPLFASYVP